MSTKGITPQAVAVCNTKMIASTIEIMVKVAIMPCSETSKERSIVIIIAKRSSMIIRDSTAISARRSMCTLFATRG